VLSVAIPVGVFLGSIYALYTYLVGRFDPFHAWLLVGTAVVATLAVIAALAGIDMAICLVILMLAPAVTVIGYEILGHRHQAEALAEEGTVAPMADRRMHVTSPLPHTHRQ
jgi:hypothetical protein